MFDLIFVVFVGEFGRMLLVENCCGWEGGKFGWDYYFYVFSLFMVGGGMWGGYVYGEMDEIGWVFVKDFVYVNDFYVMLLYFFGMDYLKFVYCFKGFDVCFID